VPLTQTRLGAAAFAVGLLALIPQIGFIALSPIANRIIDRLGGAKRASLCVCWMQIALMSALTIPIHLSQQPWSVPLAVALICAFGVTGAIGQPAWMAWASSFVPRLISGRYLAGRMRLFNLMKLAFAALFAAIASALPLDAGPWGIQAIIAIAVLSRLASIWCLRRQPFIIRPAQPESPGQQADGGMLAFLRTIHRSDVGRWVVVWSTFQGGVMVAGPFFASYMIAPVEDGGMALDPFSYSLLLYASVISRILFYPLVGRAVDIFGPRAVLRAAFTAILLIPLPWALISDLGVLIAVEIAAGIVWGAAEVTVVALMFASHADPGRRAQFVAYFGAISAVCVSAGTALGTLLVDLLPPVMGSSYHTLFLVSFALRLPGAFLAWRWLPSLRLPDRRESRQLMTALPGVELISAFGRGLSGVFRRPNP
jgi:MFS family permease